MTTHDHRAKCPWCKTLHTMADNVTGENTAPADGDVTLCIKCGEWSVFHFGTLRKPRWEEYEFIGSDKDCQKLRWAWKETNP